MSQSRHKPSHCPQNQLSLHQLFSHIPLFFSTDRLSVPQSQTTALAGLPAPYTDYP